MIKGIVNGVEKDVVRIPMKGKNLFDLSTATNEFINSNGSITPASAGDPYYLSDYISADNVTISVQYKETAVAEIFTVGVYDSDKRFIRRDVISNNSASYENVAYIRINYRDKNCQNVMLNLGSTPLPYEPYGYQEGWEVRKGDGTLIWGRNDTISVNSGTLPIKGYGAPLKGVEVEGNMMQESPNLVNPADNVPGYQNNDGSIHVPGSGNEMTTDFIPFTDTIYARIKATTSGNINWVAYNSEKQALYFYGGNWSGANPSFTISPSSYYNCAYIRISWTQGATQPICVTTTQQSAFVPFNPEPDDPIWPDETGERTANLAQSVEQGGITNVGEKTAASTRIRVKADVSPNTTYTFASNKPISIVSGFAGETFAHTIISLAGFPTQCTFTTGEDDTVVYVTLRNEDNTVIRPADLSGAMLNLGSTALPYEPYGYKIPLTCAGQTTPIYLGQTVRRVRKLVLDGTENITMPTTSSFQIFGVIQWGSVNGFCSHYQQITWDEVTSVTKDGFATRVSSGGADRFRISDRSITTVEDFKSYLAQQYAAGTPVTVWYVLATPETAIVNEPIRKIGTYADTLTVTDQDVTITPAVGNDTITVDTTLAPSKLSLTGHIKALPSV